MQEYYKTVLNRAEIEMEEKKSRFIASIRPVKCEQEALDFINELRTRYWDASHNVYAYYIRNECVIQRYSDDGEPAGTAGLPVMDVLRKKELQDVAIVVTRYFGGTLLGAAGLIRAYGRSAVLAVEAAMVVVKKLCYELTIIIEYSMLGRIQNFLSSEGITIKNIVYGQDVDIIIYIPVEHLEVFSVKLQEVSNATAIIDVGNKTYIITDEKGKLIEQGG